MNSTLQTILIIVAAVLLFVAAISAAGWAFEDASLAALGFGAACAWMVAQLP